MSTEVPFTYFTFSPRTHSRERDGRQLFLAKADQSIPDSTQVGKVVAMVGMAVGVVIGVGISRALQVIALQASCLFRENPFISLSCRSILFQSDCYCKQCTYFESVGEVNAILVKF